MGLKLRKLIIPIFLVFIISASFGLGAYFGKSSAELECRICQPEEINFSLFWESYHKLLEKFVDKGKIDQNKVIYGAISGMVKSLDDPYTVFLPPEETKRFEEDVKGVFEGVGMEIGIKKGQLQVISPLEGTPAQRAGLRPGDKIIKINDVSTADLAVDEAVNLIRGPKGTEVILTIFRADWEKTQEIKLIRDVIKIPSLKLEFKERDIAYIKIYQFSGSAGSDFRETANKILTSPSKKIIMDLRNNPGGYLEIAQEITGWFLERGETVVIEDFGGKKEQKIYPSPGPGRFSKYPIVLLINEGSASASEILAGALKDNRGIKLIGEKSYGKGSVQELETLSGGSSLKITIAKWLTPKGESITDKGLEPDIKIEMTEEDYEKDRDPQLDKAIEIIREMR